MLLFFFHVPPPMLSVLFERKKNSKNQKKVTGSQQRYTGNTTTNGCCLFCMCCSHRKQRSKNTKCKKAGSKNEQNKMVRNEDASKTKRQRAPGTKLNVQGTFTEGLVAFFSWMRQDAPLSKPVSSQTKNNSVNRPFNTKKNAKCFNKEWFSTLFFVYFFSFAS